LSWIDWLFFIEENENPNQWGAAAHTIMRTSQIIWDEYKIDPIRESKGW